MIVIGGNFVRHHNCEASRIRTRIFVVVKELVSFSPLPENKLISDREECGQ